MHQNELTVEPLNEKAISVKIPCAEDYFVKMTKSQHKSLFSENRKFEAVLLFCYPRREDKFIDKVIVVSEKSCPVKIYRAGFPVRKIYKTADGKAVPYAYDYQQEPKILTCKGHTFFRIKNSDEFFLQAVPPLGIDGLPAGEVKKIHSFFLNSHKKLTENFLFSDFEIKTKIQRRRETALKKIGGNIKYFQEHSFFPECEFIATESTYGKIYVYFWIDKENLSKDFLKDFSKGFKESGISCVELKSELTLERLLRNKEIFRKEKKMFETHLLFKVGTLFSTHFGN